MVVSGLHELKFSAELRKKEEQVLHLDTKRILIPV